MQIGDTIKLINISIISHSYLLFFVVRAFKIYSISKFQVHDFVVV